MFNENIAAAKVPVETHNHLVKISTDKTVQLQFTSEDLGKF